jgi:hypothetical protein
MPIFVKSVEHETIAPQGYDILGLGGLRIAVAFGEGLLRGLRFGRV